MKGYDWYWSRIDWSKKVWQKIVWPKIAAGIGVTLLQLKVDAATGETMKRPHDNDSAFNNPSYFVSDAVTYDDNLYRLSKNFGDTNALIGSGASRSDLINRAALGANGKIFSGQQYLQLQGQIEDWKFRENDNLDHVAGDASAVWSWIFLSRLAGVVGAEYHRSLADFAYTRSYEKDLLNRHDYYLDLSEHLTPRWSLTGEARTSRTDHTLSINTVENTRTDSWKAGVAYETPRKDSFGLDYRGSRTTLPNFVVPLGGTSPDYRDQSGVAWLKYNVSSKTQFETQIGQQRRTCDEGSVGDFSGTTGRATFDWSPLSKTHFKLSLWRELQAYLETGSEYFVSRGGSVDVLWSPTEVFTIDGSISHENDAFQSDKTLVTTLPTRNDKISSGALTASYRPRKWLLLQLSYKRQMRTSNRDLQDFTDNTTMLIAKLQF